MASNRPRATGSTQIDFKALLQEIHDTVRPTVARGKVADYIPALAKVSADKFGIAVRLDDGRYRRLFQAMHVGDESCRARPRGVVPDE